MMTNANPEQTFSTPSADQQALLDALLAEAGFAGSRSQTIMPRQRQGPAPLSFAQQRLWFLDQLEPGNPAYNIPTAQIHLAGKLDQPALEQSLAEMVRRHHSLRTIFTLVDDQPVQQVTAADWHMEVVDLRALPAPERLTAIERRSLAEARRPFDLSQGPLFRAVLLQLVAEEHVLLISMHHIISDGWSLGVMYRELAALYEAFLHGRPSPLPALPLQYTDYAAWQQEWAADKLATQLAYWQQQLAAVPPLLPLPTDFARPPQAGYHPSVRHLFKLSPDLSTALENLSRQQGTTLFMTLLAAFQLLLYRYTRQTDICVGSPIANRNHREIEDLIGFFVNTLVLRSDMAGNPVFTDVLQQVKQTALDAFEHQDLPFEKLVEALQPERDLSLTPFFQVMFVLQNAPVPTFRLPDLTMRITEIDSGTAKFDLILEMVETPTGLSGSIEYDTTLFKADTIERLAGHFKTLLAEIVARPEMAIDALPLLTEGEKETLITTWNQTERDFALDRCMHHYFEQWVEQTPNAVAVTCDDDRLTYRHLNERANRLARLLLAHDIGPERIVALLARRSIDFLTMILAVFKAGGAYLPLDPLHPPQRYRQILTQSRAPLVLAAADFLPALDEALLEVAEEDRPTILPLETALQQQQDSANLPPAATLSNLAYVIFTSGSTGLPKGAMVDHRGMLNHLWSKVEDLALTTTEIVGQNASQCFDISVWQFLAALLVGGQVRIFTDEIVHDPTRLLAEVSRRRLTIFQLVPSMLRAIIQATTYADSVPPDLQALRWVVPTGEALTTELCRQWLELYPEIPMLNAYGSTECSDDQCHHPVRIAPPPAYHLPTISIGRAMANVQIYILDRLMTPVPLGVAGEIFVGGIGVGRGYLHDPLRTAAVFIPDPFSPIPGRRLYKTGDLGRYLLAESGQPFIEFLGRVDFMVKIRGFRIELGEIEAVLARHPDIQQAVVLARSPAASAEAKYLAAYVVPAAAADLTTSSLRDYLKDKLPDYMIPAAFVMLAALPLTANGKLNRRALPEPELSRPELDAAYQPPASPLEVLLANIWAEVLGVDRVGVADDFFDLGGHSLLATQLIFRIRAALQVDLPLRDFFVSPTVARLALTIEMIRRGDPATGSTATDFAAEVVLDAAIQPAGTHLLTTAAPSAILLTGATGFLGAFLLAELLRQTQATIYCLVRAENATAGLQRLQATMAQYRLWDPALSSRLVPVVGDLARPGLGLSESAFADLAASVEAIYHNGALVNFVLPYYKLKAANVLGTQEILRLATLQRLIPLHYVSTTSVFDALGYFDGQTPVITESEVPRHGDSLLYGYAQSKWVAERLVLEARQRGLPVAIYRPGTVVGDSRSGLWNTGDFLSRFIKGCIQLEAVPDLVQVQRLAPVDFAASAMVYLARQPQSLGQNYHVLSPYEISLSRIAQIIRTLGYHLASKPYPEWQTDLIKAGPKNALFPLLPLFVEWVAGEERLTVMELLVEGREPEFAIDHLTAGLANSGITCPPVEEALLTLYLEQFRASRFLES